MAESTDSDPKEMNIYQRLHAVTADLGFLEKDKTVKYGGNKGAEYEYISHDAVSAAVRVPLIKHGVVVIPRMVKHEKDGNRTEVTVEVDFVNIDQPQDRVTVPVIGYGVDPSDKGPGKAFSYAMKYAYLKLFILNSADDIEKDYVEHDPGSARASDVAAAKNQATNALEVWAENFKAAIASSPTVEALKELQKKNKNTLMGAPQVTRDYFIDLIEKRKAHLAPAANAEE